MEFFKDKYRDQMRKRAVDLIEWILDTGDNRHGIKSRNFRIFFWKIMTDFNGFLMILVPYKRRLGLTREDVQTPVKSRREGECLP